MTAPNPPPASTLSPALAWDAVRAAAREPGSADGTYALAAGGRLEPVAARDPGAVLVSCEGHWSACPACPPPARRLMDLYLPLCGPAHVLTLAHLGQSVDGFIASASGDSYYVTGPENIVHLHRLRALCDAVVVGAGTVAVDDPRLTTRLVPGPHPTRVVLDPGRRLPVSRAVFTDRQAPTLLVCDATLAAHGPTEHGHAETLGIPLDDQGLDLRALLGALHARGLRRVLVEGGGVTVSRFVEAAVVDRLHLAVAPLILGNGRPGLRGEPRQRLADYPRPPCRIFLTGQDILYDYDLRGDVRGDRPDAPAPGDAVPVPVYPP